MPIDHKGQEDSHHDGADTNDSPQGNGDVTGGDGPESLLGMETVSFDVGRVVEVIGPRGGQTEANKRANGLEKRLGLVDHAGRAGGGKDQQVLDPLLGPGLHQHGAGQ